MRNALTPTRLQSALEAGLLAQAEQVAREIFADQNACEADLSVACIAMFDYNIQSGFDLLEQFVSRFQHSLYLPRVCLADLYSRSSMYDQATEYARYYLRLVQDTTPDFSAPELQEAICRAFLILTCVYTILGARSYSQRVLSFALTQQLNEQWRHALESEHQQLELELTDEAHSRVDRMWEVFFNTGQGADGLMELCNEAFLPMMAQRVQVLATSFREQPAFKVDHRELFLLLFKNEAQILFLN